MEKKLHIRIKIVVIFCSLFHFNMANEAGYPCLASSPNLCEGPNLVGVSNYKYFRWNNNTFNTQTLFGYIFQTGVYDLLLSGKDNTGCEYRYEENSTFNLNWTAAEAQCRFEGGNLADIRSYAETALIQNIFIRMTSATNRQPNFV